MFTKECTYCLAAPGVLLGLDICCNINYDPLASIKRLFSVPRCCVLPKDMVSGLAMHGKLVALSRGATTLGIRAALTVGHARLSRVNCTLDTGCS